MYSFQISANMNKHTVVFFSIKFPGRKGRKKNNKSLPTPAIAIFRSFHYKWSNLDKVTCISIYKACNGMNRSGRWSLLVALVVLSPRWSGRRSIQWHFPCPVGERIRMVVGNGAGPIHGGGDVRELWVRGLDWGVGAWQAGWSGSYSPCWTGCFVTTRVTIQVSTNMIRFVCRVADFHPLTGGSHSVLQRQRPVPSPCVDVSDVH